jgi:hypothetical protein
MFSFVAFLVSFFFAPWISLVFFVIFIISYKLFKWNPDVEVRPQEIHITHHIGNLQKEICTKEDIDDFLPYFDRSKFEF